MQSFRTCCVLDHRWYELRKISAASWTFSFFFFRLGLFFFDSCLRFARATHHVLCFFYYLLQCRLLACFIPHLFLPFFVSSAPTFWQRPREREREKSAALFFRRRIVGTQACAARLLLAVDGMRDVLGIFSLAPLNKYPRAVGVWRNALPPSTCPTFKNAPRYPLPFLRSLLSGLSSLRLFSGVPVRGASPYYPLELFDDSSRVSPHHSVRTFPVQLAGAPSLVFIFLFRPLFSADLVQPSAAAYNHRPASPRQEGRQEKEKKKSRARTDAISVSGAKLR